MLKHQSPSLAISLLALFVALGGVGYSATGGNFLLGKTNTATTQTRLVAPLGAAAFRVDNDSTLSTATGIRIVTNAARPPLIVNSSAKVANLNADLLDGLDPVAFSRSQSISFHLLPFDTTDPIRLPNVYGGNAQILVMGGEASQPSVGQVTLVKRSGSLYWVGLESGGTGITSGGSAIAGTHIVYLDSGHDVDIEVSGAGAIQVHNHGNSIRSGTLTLTWLQI